MSQFEPAHLHLAVALDGSGWHPAAWRQERAEPDRLFEPSYWVRLVQRAEEGLIDFVTFEDGLSVQSIHRHKPDGRTDQVRGRLDAVMLASRVAPCTQRIGLVPSVTITHTEPFHLSKAIATLDYVSGGRAGVRFQISGRAHEMHHFGRRPPYARGADQSELFDEAADYIEVVRRLWDSWEDDAEIRDAATGRFIDRHKLHYIDFSGPWFSVRGPSITPRPPQGQPVVTVLAHVAPAYRLAAEQADLVYITPRDAHDVRSIMNEIARQRTAVPRPVPDDPELSVWGDVVVVLGPDRVSAVSRLSALDDQAGYAWSRARTDAMVFAGTAVELAELLGSWHDAGMSGVRLRPAVLPDDLDAIVADLVPELQRQERYPTEYVGASLRERLGRPRPANRYAA